MYRPTNRNNMYSMYDLATNNIRYSESKLNAARMSLQNVNNLKGKYFCWTK